MAQASVCMPLVVVINPSSRDFAAERKFPRLRRALERGGPIEVVETDPDDEVTRAKIQQAAEGEPPRMVVVGGDGTVHAVVNALMNAGLKTLPELAVVPFGTANDVAKSVGLPVGDLDALVATAVGPHTAPFDVGWVEVFRDENVRESRYFIDSVTVGMDADVLARRASFRGLKGYLGYVPAMAERAIEQQSIDVRATVDDEIIDTRVFNLVINNAPIYAGELRLPGSEAGDGLLDLFLFNRREYVSKLITFLMKQVDVLGLGAAELLDDITDNQRAHHGRQIKARLASPRRVQVDGEVFGEASEISCSVAGTLRMACPDSGAD